VIPTEIAPRRPAWTGIARCFLYFLCQPNPDLHPLHKTSLLVFPAEGTGSIHDPIHLPKGYTVHPLVQVLKGCFHGIGICYGGDGGI